MMGHVAKRGNINQTQAKNAIEAAKACKAVLADFETRTRLPGTAIGSGTGNMYDYLNMFAATLELLQTQIG